MGPGGVAEVSLRPRIDAGRLTFALDAVNVFGRPTPDQYRQTIEERTLRGNPTELKRS
ncbi:hypothetical protein ACWCOZ_00330 [Streptomyces sp. NPDC001840]